MTIEVLVSMGQPVPPSASNPDSDEYIEWICKHQCSTPCNAAATVAEKIAHRAEQVEKALPAPVEIMIDGAWELVDAPKWIYQQ